jgi:hypothetical protein
MIDPNKKKIRGWKRRVAHVDSWFDKYKIPNITPLTPEVRIM